MRCWRSRPRHADSTTGQVAFHAEASSNSFLNDGITTTSGYFVERPGIAGALRRDNSQELRILRSRACYRAGSRFLR